MKDFSVRFDKEHYGKKPVMLDDDAVAQIRQALKWGEDIHDWVLQDILKQVDG